MTLIDDTVRKLFGTKLNQDPNSKEFMNQSFKNTENVCAKYFEQTPESMMEEFIFEQSDIAKQLKDMMEKLNDSPEEKNT